MTATPAERTSGHARGGAGLLRAVVLPPQQLRQLGDVGSDPARLVAGGGKRREPGITA